ncbi:MAG: hypothetical protein EOP51_04175 [Sphingobacteriales bacterium]|nr:MAG: hypothetical protein EOP51_04175 [Sphingobacteriales bacterium]
MKKALIAVLFAAVACTTFTSCRRTYYCECIDYKGNVTQFAIESGNKIQARNKCDQKGAVNNCDIK